MKTILILAEKGGVGKTFLADEIAFSLERSGIRTAFYDFNQQGGPLHSGIPVPDPEVNVVDTPGQLKKDWDAWMETADVIVIPTLAGGNSEIPPFMTTLKKASQSKKDLVVVFNKKHKNYKTSKGLESALKDLPFKFTLVTIPDSQDIPNASLNGMSVVRYRKRGDAAKAVLKAVNEIRQLAGIEPEIL